MTTRLQPSILVIGIGNEFRSDDGAGLVVVRHLRSKLPPEVEVVETNGEAAEILDLWKHRQRVFLVDAIQSATAQPRICRWEGPGLTLPKEFFCCSTHAMGVAEAIELGQTLHQMPDDWVIYGIRGEHFGPGRGLSSAVDAAVEQATEQLLAEIKGSLKKLTMKKTVHS